MQYPTIQQYKTAVLIGEDSFRTLKGIEIIMNPDFPSEPIFMTGGFGVVFKVKYNTKYYALKCYIKHVEDREFRLKEIAKYLKYNISKYFVDFQYLTNELWVDETNNGWDIILMEWIEGPNLYEKINELCVDRDIIGLTDLYHKQKDAFSFLQKQPIAHGDLKPDNIIVSKEGNIRFIDYDGMFVPRFSRLESLELGSVYYQAPDRASAEFNRHIDNFSIYVILFSIRYLLLFTQRRDVSNYEYLVFDDQMIGQLHTGTFQLPSTIKEPIINQILSEFSFLSKNSKALNFWNNINAKWQILLKSSHGYGNPGDILGHRSRNYHFTKPNISDEKIIELVYSEDLKIDSNIHKIDIDNISQLQNLKNLNLVLPYLVSIEPIGLLAKLESLVIKTKQGIVSLEPLTNNYYLRSLIIDSEFINDFTPISRLSNLESFHIYVPTSIKFYIFNDLAKLKSVTLYCRFISFADIEENESIEELGLTECSIIEAGNIAKLKNLEDLSMYNTGGLQLPKKLKKLTLAGKSKLEVGLPSSLEYLKLRRLPKIDTNSLIHLQHLTVLDVSYISEFENLEKLRSLSSLKKLHIFFYEYIGIFDVFLPPSLEELDLMGITVDLSFLGNLNNLKKLSIIGKVVIDSLDYFENLSVIGEYNIKLDINPSDAKTARQKFNDLGLQFEENYYSYNNFAHFHISS